MPAVDAAVQELRVPSLVLFGGGQRRQAGEIAARSGGRALVVIGGGSIERSGMLGDVLAALAAAGVEAAVFKGVAGEPTVETVEHVRGRLRQTSAAVAIAIGGGSVIDAAKAACGTVNEPHPVREYQRGRQISERCLPLVALPTTAGTGAEATPNAVITDPQEPSKRSIRHADMLPAAAIVDPEMTYSCPRHVRAWAGLDALVQAIESHTSRRAGLLTRALSAQAIRLVGRNLLAACRSDAGRAAQAAVAAGSLLAGMALANARLGAVHGLAHPIGAHFGLPHGLVCGVLFAHIARLNADAAGEVYEEEVTPHMNVSRPDVGDTLASRFEKLLSDLGVQPVLHVRKLPADDAAWRQLAAESMTSGSFQANPRALSETEVLSVLKKALASAY